MTTDPTAHWLIISTNDDGVLIYDRSTLQLIHQISTGRDNGALALSPNGATLAVGGNGPFINVRDAASGQPEFDLVASPEAQAILDLAFTPDGQSLLALEANGTLRTWNLATRTSSVLHLSAGSTSNELQADSVIDVASNFVVLRIYENAQCRTVVDDATTGATLHTLNTCGLVNVQGTRLASTVLDPDGFEIDAVEIWDLVRGLKITTFPIPVQFNLSLAFSPDGKSLAIGSSDYGTIQIWPVP